MENVKMFGEIIDELKKYSLERFEVFPFTPIVAWEFAVYSYLDNPYFKKMNLEIQPCAIFFQDDKFEAWIDNKTKPNLSDKELIKKIIIDSKEIVSKNEASISEFVFSDKELDGQKCLEQLEKLNNLFIELYHGYSFFTEEYFDISDKELLKILPETRIVLSNFADIVWRAYLKILNFAEKVSSLTLKELERCSSEEIIKVLKGEDVVKLRLTSRAFALVVIDGRVIKVVGNEALEVKDYLEKNVSVVNFDKKILRGNVACMGKVKGRVALLDVADYGEYNNAFVGKRDFILVTPMTRPELIPYLGNCIGIVTDEGGITCHAAIVAREFNIPCIVGTDSATRVLKEGDLIEIDGNLGTVKVIERREKIL